MIADDSNQDILDAQAVAVKESRAGTNALPRITASGKGYLAERILELAFAHGVKVRQDSELTSILAKLEVESPVPLEALECVAEILRRVYQANSQMEPAVKPGDTQSGDQDGVR